MRIVQKANSECVVTKIPMTCDEHPPIADPLPGMNFFMLLVGQPGSGKTNLLLNLICKRGKMYNKKFDRVEYFGPSRHTINYPIDLPEDRFHAKFDAEMITKMFEALHERNGYTLWIFDDCNVEIRKAMEAFDHVVFNRRHASAGKGGLSIIVVTQVFNVIPPHMRKSLDSLAMFDNGNQEEIESLRKELLGFLTRKDLRAVLKQVFSTPHQFLFVNFKKPQRKRLHCGFNELEIVLSEDEDDSPEIESGIAGPEKSKAAKTQ